MKSVEAIAAFRATVPQPPPELSASIKFEDDWEYYTMAVQSVAKVGIPSFDSLGFLISLAHLTLSMPRATRRRPLQAS
jgi:hypothetical protein